MKLVQIEKIVNALKFIYKHNSEILPILESGDISLNLDKQYNVASITVSFYDSLEIDKHVLWFTPEHGSRRELLTYARMQDIPDIARERYSHE